MGQKRSKRMKPAEFPQRMGKGAVQALRGVTVLGKNTVQFPTTKIVKTEMETTHVVVVLGVLGGSPGDHKLG